MLIIDEEGFAASCIIYLVLLARRLSLSMFLRVSRQGMVESALPLYSTTEQFLFCARMYLYQSKDPKTSSAQPAVMLSAQGPFQLMFLALNVLLFRLKQSIIPFVQEQGFAAGGSDKFKPREMCLRIDYWECWFIVVVSLQKQQPYMSIIYLYVLQQLISFIVSQQWSVKQRQPAERGSLWHDDLKQQMDYGSTKSWLSMNSTVDANSYPLLKLMMPLPTSMPCRLNLKPSALLLNWMILSARSGMYLPAQLQPANQNGLAPYSLNPTKNVRSASRLSCVVVASLYWKLGSSLREYPTPAGDSRKRRCDALNQVQGLGVSMVLGVQLWPYGRQKGAIYWRKPMRDEQPGPPFSHRVTGREELAVFSMKMQQRERSGLPVLRYPEQILPLKSAGYPYIGLILRAPCR